MSEIEEKFPNECRLLTKCQEKWADGFKYFIEAQQGILDKIIEMYIR